MDRRIQKTRTAILSAFERLLAEKRYEQITVQDIINEANIGRSTFYAHFETKDDLLRYTCRELFEHIFDEHLTSEISHDFSDENGSLDVMLTHILYHLKDDRKRYMRIPEDYYVNYYCSAYMKSVKWWCQHDLKISPEELASYFESVTSLLKHFP